MPRSVKIKDLADYIVEQGGELVQISNGNYNVRCGQKSRNIGRPNNGRFKVYQLRRAWGELAAGIRKPRWL